jgi:hypothetical protein
VPNSIPPLSTLGTSAEYYDDDAKAMMLSVDGGAYAPYATGSTAGVLQQVADFNLAADVITTALSPVYTTLLTGSITTTLAASFLQIQHYNTVIFLGGAASTRTCTIRLRLNGVLLPISRTSTQNAQTTSQIMNLNILRRVPIVAGLQTVIVEWTRFGGGVGNTMNCRPATLPDLEGAFLQLQEHAP